MRKLAAVLMWLAGSALAPGAEIGPLRTGTAANELSCALAQESAKVGAGDAQVFVRFVARGVGAGESVRVEWVSPRGAVEESATYSDLPRARQLCFLNAMQVGGFAPAAQPGRWRVRVSLGAAVAAEREFDITGVAAPMTARVAEVNDGEIVVDAWGAGGETTVNIARYTPRGGWEYVAVALAERQEAGRMWVRAPRLAAGEYLVILRNPDGTQSLPARFVVTASGGYREPAPPGEKWRVSQRPYGSYSHWGRARHAWDFVPVGGRLVAAMRAGVVEAHDLGLGQTPGRRIFGNYITIRHDDGEYSHYAHLKTGAFRVRTGQHVVTGQVLAEVGNSGYSFGRHVHVHVTRTKSISAPSVPFRFGKEGAVVTSARTAPPHRVERWTGAAAFAQWWSRLLKVPRGARRLAVRLGWDDAGNEFDLYLVSPRGRVFRAEGRQVDVARPEAGQWRVSVQGVRNAVDEVGFWVEPEITPKRP